VAQRNAMTAWVNYVLVRAKMPHVRDLVADVSSGVLLYQLLKAVAGQGGGRERERRGEEKKGREDVEGRYGGEESKAKAR
jgi:hypothetical protein